MMSVAYLFAALVFAGGRIERAIRWLFVADFALAVAALVAFWLVYLPLCPWFLPLEIQLPGRIAGNEARRA